MADHDSGDGSSGECPSSSSEDRPTSDRPAISNRRGTFDRRTPELPTRDRPDHDPLVADHSIAAAEAAARIICLRLLDQRARTRAELAIALAGKGIPDYAATAVLDRFAEVGLIDDAALALQFATARHRERRLAPRAISAALKRRGVEDETIAEAISVIDADSERRAARELVEAKLRRLDGFDPDVATRRLTALLARRGYSSSIVYATVREAIRDRGGDPPESLTDP